MRYTLLVLLVLSPSIAAGLSFEGYDAKRHDRFYDGADRAFIGDDQSIFPKGLDLTGVGRIDGLPYHVSMISDTYFVGARHTLAGPGNQPGTATIEFFDDDSSTTWSGSTVAAEYFDSGDFFIGKLSQPAPTWVKRYPVLKLPQIVNTDFEYETTVAIYGNTPADPSPTYTPGAVGIGTATISAGKKNYGLSGDVHILSRGETFASDPNVWGNDAVSTIAGDSGSPTFAFTDAGPAVIGTHQGPSNYDNLVSYYADDTLAYVSEPISIVTPLLGDVDSDFDVDNDDLAIVTANFGGAGPFTYNNGDINGDGAVDFSDVITISPNIGASFMTAGKSDFVGGGDGPRIDDLLIIAQNFGSMAQNPGTMGDANSDGIVNMLDWDLFEDERVVGMPAVSSDYDGNPIVFGDIDNSNGRYVVDFLDVSALIGQIDKAAMVGGSSLDLDLNGDGLINAIDGDLNADGVIDNSDGITLS
ncbi:MAG: hypothetical protein AAF085_16640, partial [Planctomycetota bacterium]